MESVSVVTVGYVLFVLLSSWRVGDNTTGFSFDRSSRVHLHSQVHGPREVFVTFALVMLFRIPSACTEPGPRSLPPVSDLDSSSSHCGGSLRRSIDGVVSVFKTADRFLLTEKRRKKMSPFTEIYFPHLFNRRGTSLSTRRVFLDSLHILIMSCQASAYQASARLTARQNCLPICGGSIQIRTMSGSQAFV